MGTAASSALRTDIASDGPAYGSLEAMAGGMRKLKKKPVLVLDPEELAQAHAMFHEASAELLGEDVERAPRPVAILGLAPMDDDEDADEMDQADEAEAEADLPAPEAVLSLTRKKTALPPLDDFAAEDPAADQDESLPAMDDVPIAAPIEDGLDLATRIFPSLPLRPLEQDEDDIEDDVEVGDSASDKFAGPEKPVAMPENVPELPRSLASEPEPEPESSTEEPDLTAEKAIVPDQFTEMPAAPAAPVSKPPQGTVPRDEFTFTPAPSSRPAITPAPAPVPAAGHQTEVTQRPAPAALHAPVHAQAPDAAPIPSGSPDSENALRPARFDELNPTKDYETPEEVYDLDNWLAEPQSKAAAVIPETSLQQEPEAEAQATAKSHDIATVESVAVEDTSEAEAAPAADETLTGDDQIDGYAFMRDPRSRRSAIASAQQGRQSALRAKLLRDAEEDAAKAQQKDASGSDLMAFWSWIKGFFAPKS
ncbi:hypothetical protein [Aurantiacibacter marinus]|uniref:Uncharacterized protein n=1 Tax=Aurantiacibacter marinus TaxID=874156 RepID=A0A0H0XLB5_9SPHN|nr:hypothetical protein [Aurantiacibacter marinus]KLI63149.1 hypothetical protein AAV99_10680 [Aurantiacibacter marinus]